MQPDIGTTIVTTWFGSEMPRLHATCIASWLANGYRAVIYSYRNEISGLPSKAEIVDASTILSEDKMFFLKNKTAYAHFSDIFRLELLKNSKGIWCDADYLVLRPFPEFNEIMIGKERGNWPCNAVMWMPPDHPIVTNILRTFHHGNLADWTYFKPQMLAAFYWLIRKEFTISDLPNGHWGRHALKHYIRKLKLTKNLQPQDRFYAPETYIGELFEKTDFSRISDNPEVSGTHFFNKRAQKDAPKEGSFYAWAHQRYYQYL